MIKIETSGSFSKTMGKLKKMSSVDISTILNTYGQKGVSALASATPVGSGESAASWDFVVESNRGSHSITWTNSHLANGVPIVILLQYGHGTGTGGYVQGRDFINPAIKPIFDRIAKDVWREVKSE